MSDLGSAEFDAVDRTSESLRDMETVISRILQLGVVVSAVVVTLGVAAWAAAGTTGYLAHSYPTSLLGVWHGLLALKPLAVIQSGLLLLILTPVIRVAASVVVFHQDHDRIFTVITVVVLSLLLFGIFYGGGE